MKLEKIIIVAVALWGSASAYAVHTHSPHGDFFGGHAGYTGTGPWYGTPVVTETHVDELIYTAVNGNCSCGSAEWEDSTTRERTHTVSVSGSATTSVKNGLATELIAKAHATITLSGGWEGSWKETINVTIKKTMPQCTRHKYEKYKTKYVATGHTPCATYAWSDSLGHSGKCDEYNITGSSTGWGGERNEWTGDGPCTGSPCDNPAANCGG